MVSYVIGSSSGYVKAFTISEELVASRIKVHSVPVVDIAFADSNDAFNHQSIVFVLTEDQAVQVLNIEKGLILSLFKGSIIPLRKPLTISIHASHRYFVESFDDGCLQIWRISQDLV